MLKDILNYPLWGDTVQEYLASVLIIAVGLSVARLLRGVARRRIRVREERGISPLEDFLLHVAERSIFPFLYLGIIYASLRSLALTPGLHRAVDVAGVVLLTVIGIRLGTTLLTIGVERFWLRKEEDASQRQNLIRLMPVVKVLIWAAGVVFLLDNLGFKISAVVAGLGIGGVAVALAAQAVLGDLFSYFAILFDKPFELGDFIITGEYMGTIEHIGIKTTRIRSLGGEQLVFSNSDLTNSRIRNYKRMERRRVVFRFGVVYQTEVGRLREIPGIVKDIIARLEGAEVDRAHFVSFGDSSLDFEVVYYVLSGDYAQYMDIQQKINLALAEEFAARGIDFAYPTRTLYVVGEMGRKA